MDGGHGWSAQICHCTFPGLEMNKDRLLKSCSQEIGQRIQGVGGKCASVAETRGHS